MIVNTLMYLKYFKLIRALLLTGRAECHIFNWIPCCILSIHFCLKHFFCQLSNKKINIHWSFIVLTFQYSVSIEPLIIKLFNLKPMRLLKNSNFGSVRYKVATDRFFPSKFAISAGRWRQIMHPKNGGGVARRGEIRVGENRTNSEFVESLRQQCL